MSAQGHLNVPLDFEVFKRNRLNHDEVQPMVMNAGEESS